MDAEKQRQHRRDDARLIESGNARSEQLLSCGAYRVADQQRMAARRALEWIGASEARLVFRYEISDLFNKTMQYYDALHSTFRSGMSSECCSRVLKWPPFCFC